MWKAGREAGLEVGVGTQDLSLRCLLTIQVEMTRRFVINLDSKEIWAGDRNLTIGSIWLTSVCGTR